MTLFEWNLPQKRQSERERETEREREGERESEREREHKINKERIRKKERKKERERASSMSNDMVTAGGSPIALQCFVHISDQKTPAISLRWSSTILTVTHIYKWPFLLERDPAPKVLSGGSDRPARGRAKQALVNEVCPWNHMCSCDYIIPIMGVY